MPLTLQKRIRLSFALSAFVAIGIPPSAHADVVGPGAAVGGVESLFDAGAAYPGVAIAQAPDGSFVVAYHATDEDKNVFARRFNADGSPNGDAFRVNTTTANIQDEPSVAMSRSGAFVITWESADAPETEAYGYYAFSQAFDANGNRIGGEVAIPNEPLRWGEQPKAAMAADGSFVVVWNGGQGVYAHRFTADGSPTGSVIEVAPHIDWARLADVAMTGDGGFIVAWTDETDVDGEGVRVRKYAADGGEVSARSP